MCPPHYYNVAHRFQNVHMKMSREVLHNKAQRQWVKLYNLLTHELEAKVLLTPPAVGMVDMVFAANAALIKGDKAVVANFAAHARRGETPAYKRILDEFGFRTFVPDDKFEGQGDALFSHNGEELWIGHGFRTISSSHREVGEFLGMDYNRNVHSLLLVEPEYYHLDTCFCPLDGGHLLFYPKAFSSNDVRLFYDKFGKDNCIEVSEEDAKNFACNAISLGNKVVLNRATEKLTYDLQDHGYDVYENNMSEFLLSGGSTKCSILHLDLPPAMETLEESINCTIDDIYRDRDD